MADLLGESPNLLDDLFLDLKTWEAVLNALPDLPVDDISSEYDPPGISPP